MKKEAVCLLQCTHVGLFLLKKHSLLCILIVHLRSRLWSEVLNSVLFPILLKGCQEFVMVIFLTTTTIHNKLFVDGNVSQSFY